MKASELSDKIRTYRWLKELAEDYDRQLNRLKKEGDAVKVDYVCFTCRSDRIEQIKFNCHRTISPVPFIKAIRECLNDVRKEMGALREEIEKVVELD